MPPRSRCLDWLRDACTGELPKGCIDWPFSVTSGYGQVRYQGQMMKAHRAALLITGQDPTGGEVRHLCHNPICVNPAHLAIGTHQDNIEDRLGRSVVLDRDAVLAIRASTERQSVLAKRFGVSPPTVSLVRSGKRWGWVT